MSMQWLNPSEFPAQATVAFAEQDMDYCQALSRALLTHKQIKEFPDLVALGYWLRRSNLTRVLEPYRQGNIIHRPLGTVYHSTPSNVDSLFVYSSILSLLCGNVNSIRLSSRRGGSSELLVQTIASLAEKYPSQNARMQLFRCEYDEPELAQLVCNVDARVLWGSDTSIVNQRKTLLAPHARELSFGHKFSLCALDAKAIIAAPNQKLTKLIADFIKDNYTFSQQACSSAKAIVWCGVEAEVKLAQDIFWAELDLQTFDKQLLSSSELYSAQAMSQQLILLDEAVDSFCMQVKACRLGVTQLTSNQVKHHTGNGVFLEIMLSELKELTPILTSEHQTMSYWGFDKTDFKIWASQQLYLDRIVPVGESLQFDLIWDGLNLIHGFSRLRGLGHI